MSLESLVQPLHAVALFKGLHPSQLTEIARRAERLTYRAGDTIILEGSAGDAAYLIVSGETIRTTCPEGRVISEPIPTGTILGEMAMLIETTYSSTVVCRTTARALKLSRISLHEQMRLDLSLADHFVAKLARRLQVLADDLRKIDQTLAAEPDLPAHSRRTEAFPPPIPVFPPMGHFAGMPFPESV